jgi:hypothetical protein
MVYSNALNFTANIVVGEKKIPVTLSMVLDYKNSFGGKVTLLSSYYDYVDGFNNNSIFKFNAAPGNYKTTPSYPPTVMSLNVHTKYFEVLSNLLNP